MKVFMIRHGESETNRDGLWTGWLDAALTEQGREDAARAGALLSHVCFDKIYSSDLQRAMDTAKIAIPGCECEPTPMLREINVGDIAGKPLGVVRDADGNSLNKDGYALFGGESYAIFRARVSEFKRHLEGAAEERIAVFAHGGFLKAFLDLVLDVQLSRESLCCKNCTVAIFEYGNGIWKLHSWINLY